MDDEFGFSSGDEAELLSLAQNAEKSEHKRKISDSTSRGLSKRAAREIPTSFPSATKALQENFGLQAFRLKQEQAIARILSGKSAVVVFPTGGGKSLVYQVPALVFAEEDKAAGIRGPGEHGLTLVVSPLIALMKDQVDALVRRGINAAAMDSTKSREEYLHTCDMMRNGELKLLYVAPERLNNEGFVAQMKHVRGGIRLLAVDEAHCVSEWGHAFRPDYLKIARFVTEIQAERVVCLTATATPQVADDICKTFQIEKAGLFRTSTYRPNLHLLAESGETKQELYPRLFKFLKDNEGPSIVYVTLQKQTEQLATELRAQGFKAQPFHAGMDTAVKTKLQDQFMKSKDLIVVATIAFGMGVDKADIRSVVHFSVPSSLESYSQEVGRAGRDGKTSVCMFYVCGEDLHLRELFSRGDLPSLTSVRGLLTEVFDSENSRLPIGGEIKVSQYSQGNKFDIRSNTLGNIYAQLELTHHILRASTPMYTKYTFKANPSYASKLASDQTKAASAIKTFGKVATKGHLYHIDLDNATARTGVPRTDIVQKLNSWNADGDLELKPSGVLNVYKVLKKLPKTAAEIETITRAIHQTMVNREKEALERSEKILDVVKGNSCFTRAVAGHFGDELPDGKEECGHCTFCITKKPVTIILPPKPKFNRAAFNAILAAVPSRDDARFLAKVAFGISSPRMTAEKISRQPIFGSMEDHEFMDLLEAFTKACANA